MIISAYGWSMMINTTESGRIVAPGADLIIDKIPTDDLIINKIV